MRLPTFYELFLSRTGVLPTKLHNYFGFRKEKGRKKMEQYQRTAPCRKKITFRTHPPTCLRESKRKLLWLPGCLTLSCRYCFLGQIRNTIIDKLDIFLLVSFFQDGSLLMTETLYVGYSQLTKVLALPSCISTIHIVGNSLYLFSYEIGHKDGA